MKEQRSPGRLRCAPEDGGALPDTAWGRRQERIEKARASIRAKVEHPFHIVKNILSLKKARYRGSAKNTEQLFTLFGLANLLIARRRWMFYTQGVS
jgi:IS5 family transposase